MAIDHSILSFFTNAGPVVKLVMLILLGASLFSWTVILQRYQQLKKISASTFLHLQEFSSSNGNLASIYRNLRQEEGEISPAEQITRAGLEEYLRLRKCKLTTQEVVAGVERRMDTQIIRGIHGLKANLASLATIGSTSPYVGLFGTVWGIMTSFQALGAVQLATIAMVAPGISEALIATAMGLFAAIPAVVAYNRFCNQIQRIETEWDLLREEMLCSLLANHGQESMISSYQSTQVKVNPLHEQATY